MTSEEKQKLLDLIEEAKAQKPSANVRVAGTGHQVEFWPERIAIVPVIYIVLEDDENDN